LRQKLKYYFAKLIVLVVALQTLDASIDIDHIAAKMHWVNREKYDDIDTISEWLAEEILDDDDLMAETNTDDTHQSQKHVHSFFSMPVFASNNLEVSGVNPDISVTTATYPHTRNTSFHAEDFSLSNYTPPDPSAV
jgi:hypothetical protein